MKWYDYGAYIACADIISAGLVYANPVTLVFGIVMYLFWENFRKWEIDNGLG